MRIDIISELDGHSFNVTDIHCNNWEDVEHLIKSLKEFHRYCQAEDEEREIKK